MTPARILMLMAVFAVLVGCGSGDAPQTEAAAKPDSSPEAKTLSINGEMYYLERIALAPDSRSIVEVRAGNGADAPLLALATEALGTRQVPIGFDLSIDAAAVETAQELVLRAGIVSSPGPLRVTQALTIDQREGQVELGQLRIHPADQVAFGITYL
ncbi:MAG TPA: YbaY family lipoprotein, partial [Wenzhouxiangella sp.]|nr:YbaY family lipoprotein [Wenzhouxiangella sp.]